MCDCSDVLVEVSGGEMLQSEINRYIDHIRTKNKWQQLEYLHITIDGDYVDLRYRFAPKEFERLRRITGYLTADLKFWNIAKQAEERDRVKHI